MRKRRVYSVVIGVAVVVGLVVWWFRREREPEYGGKRLSEWVEMYGDPSHPNPATSAAIEHFGTNGLHYLVKWLRYEKPDWKLRLYSAINRTLVRLHFSGRLSDKRELRAAGACRALRDLGPKAVSAVGDLGNLLTDPKAFHGAGRAVLTLVAIGNTGITPLLAGLTNKDPRFLSIVATLYGTNALPAVPALLTLLKSPKLEVRDAATNALLGIQPQALANAGNKEL